MVGVPAEDGNFSLHHRVQTGSGAHPASDPMGTRGSFPGVKRPGRDVDPSPYSAEVKNAWRYTSTPPIRPMAWCSVKSTYCKQTKRPFKKSTGLNPKYLETGKPKHESESIGCGYFGISLLNFEKYFLHMYPHVHLVLRLKMRGTIPSLPHTSS
jgi:hypothetical protein